MQHEHSPLRLLARRDRDALARAARRRANELRDRAQQNVWDSLFRTLRQASAALRQLASAPRASTR